MGRNVISKGKSVKEALAIAGDLLNVPMDELEIEILENGTKGLFGLGGKPAVVKVTVKEKESVGVRELQAPGLLPDDGLEQVLNSLQLPEELTDSFAEPTVESPHFSIHMGDEDLTGKVWVTDGRIYCKDAPDQYPLVSPVPGMPESSVKLFKSGTLVSKTAVVKESDQLHIEIQEGQVEPRYELQISEDHMEVILNVFPGVRVSRRLKDKSPSNFIQLEVEESRQTVPLDMVPILKELEQMGVMHGVDMTEIALACHAEEAGSYMIARGTAPLPGKHGCFHPIRDLEVNRGLKERSDGTVDFREIQEFPTVERGQVIGVIHPPAPGTPGITVINQPILPPEVHPLTVKEGYGVLLVEEGMKVIATESGHPNVKLAGQTAIISVTPKLWIGKDVDLQTGNIHYAGSVEILGNVQDGMLVEAHGNILIRKNVHRSKVSAGSSIIVHNNMIASEITAGKGSLAAADIYRMTGEILEQVKLMAVAINQLSVVSAFKIETLYRTGLGPLINILCDGKFKALRPLITSAVQAISGAINAKLLGEEWITFIAELDQGFNRPHPLFFKSIDDLKQWIASAEKLRETLQNTDDESCFVKADFVHNCRIYSSGDLLVSGHGSYNSILHAGGRVEVSGFVRGGEIYGGLGVVIGEAGSRGGVSTKIAVPKDRTITINKAEEGTVIQIGSKSHKFNKAECNVTAKIDPEGQLIL